MPLIVAVSPCSYKKLFQTLWLSNGWKKSNESFQILEKEKYHTFKGVIFLLSQGM